MRGLIGADVLNTFDLSFDLPRGTMCWASAEMSVDGEVVPIDDFMGIPIIEASIAGEKRRMFLDTGAQVSYFQDPCLGDFPPAGVLRDFFPGIGEFETQTHQVPRRIGGVGRTVRCGALPELLGLTLAMADVEGIVGSEFFSDRSIAYLPRRGRVVLGRS
ncbi:MAG: hypothetical protein RIS35_3147 [Pseudomonadota bacterium]